uniref:hypothetical protein n=1 Tax=Alistipes sp. TaxID=1872444 RepID=UPI0040561B4A
MAELSAIVSVGVLLCNNEPMASGEIVAVGTPSEVAKNTKSHTAKYLSKLRIDN